jgi:hypothetical protein
MIVVLFSYQQQIKYFFNLFSNFKYQLIIFYPKQTRDEIN